MRFLERVTEKKFYLTNLTSYFELFRIDTFKVNKYLGSGQIFNALFSCPAVLNHVLDYCRVICDTPVF